MSSILANLQQDLADRLSADPFFSNVTVLTERIQNIEHEIERAIAELGIVAILVTPTAGVKFPNLRGPYFDNIKVVVRIVENVLINQGGTGTQKSALEVAEHVAALLHQFTPNGVSEPVLADPDTIRLVNDPLNLSYDVVFSTKGGINYQMPALDLPVVTEAAGVVTITQSNARALVLYSVDGVSHPAPRNALQDTPTAFFYDAPFLSPGTNKKILVRAWLPGYLSSQLVSYTTV